MNSEFTEPTPSFGTCLMYIPLQIHGLPVRALLDSGASDNFISEWLVSHLNLTRYPLPHALRVDMADGSSLSLTSMVRPYLHLGSLKLRLFLKVVPTPFPVILGFPFLNYFNPDIDWRLRQLTLTYGGRPHTVQAKSSLLSFA